MSVGQSQIFQATWPQGHGPCYLPYTDFIASIALVIFAAYSTGLAIFSGIMIAAFWALRKVVIWMIHLSACPFFFNSSQLENFATNRNTLKKEYESVEMITPDGVKLDGILHKGTNQKAVIFCQGNAQCYEESSKGSNGLTSTLAKDIIQGLKDLDSQTTVLCFNPRGVGLSKGTSSPDMLGYDAFTAFEYLVDKGYKPENILVMGWSLGGAYGIIGASLAQAKYPNAQIGAVSLNSFANLPLVVEHFIKGASDSQILARLAAIFVRTFIGTMDAASAWKTLKHPNKYILAHKNDQFIDFNASLYQSVPSQDNYTLLDGHSENPHTSGYDYMDTDVLPAIGLILNLQHPSQCFGGTLPSRGGPA